MIFRIKYSDVIVVNFRFFKACMIYLVRLKSQVGLLMFGSRYGGLCGARVWAVNGLEFDPDPI